MTVPPFPRRDLPTPALIVDRAALDRNIAAMARFAAGRGVALRPHAKTHKSAEIARRQVAAGAVGICCAKLSEAEALAAEGTGDIHLTSPVVSAEAIGRLARLNARIALSVVADHPDNVARLAAVDGLTVFIDVDPGNRRTGVASAEAAVALARAIADTGLRLGGVQYYCGSQQHVARFAERRAVIAAKTGYLRAVLAALGAAGHEVPVVTGGGTGSFAIDAELGVLTELQVGSYLFMDREYRDCEFAAGLAFEAALSVDATVVSANAPGLVTIDAGLKAFAADAGVPVVLAGVAGESRYAFMGDEHGAIFGDTLPGLASRVTLMPPHCDPTVNLYDRYFVVERETVVDIWPVTARGCST